jgi:hypothetical protein
MKMLRYISPAKPIKSSQRSKNLRDLVLLDNYWLAFNDCVCNECVWVRTGILFWKVLV